MKDRDATKDKTPITDSRGLMCDVQQLRYAAHQMACTLNNLLSSVPMLAMVLGPELYEKVLTETIQLHGLVCDEEKSELPMEDDPTWRLFHQTND